MNFNKHVVNASMQGIVEDDNFSFPDYLNIRRFLEREADNRNIYKEVIQ